MAGFGGYMKLWTFILATMLALTSLSADARRIGGGGSFGKQSGNVTQRQAAPQTPAAPAQGATNSAAKPATPAAAAAPKRPWGAMLGGLAAGLGLAWLANSLGLGEAFGNVLMFALLAMAAMALFGWFMRRKAALYTNFGVESVWIVDLERLEVHVIEGGTERTLVPGQRLTTPAVPGLDVDVAALFPAGN